MAVRGEQSGRSRVAVGAASLVRFALASSLFLLSFYGLALFSPATVLKHLFKSKTVSDQHDFFLD